MKPLIKLLNDPVALWQVLLASLSAFVIGCVIGYELAPPCEPECIDFLDHASGKLGDIIEGMNESEGSSG